MRSVRKHGAMASCDDRPALGAQAGGRDEPAYYLASQQRDFARWFADWWLRRGRRLAAETEWHADG
jgi:hypothetical protein